MRQLPFPCGINMDITCAELKFYDGNMISIDCKMGIANEL